MIPSRLDRSTIDTKLHQSRLLFHSEIRKICQNQRILPIEQEFNETMIDLIQRYLLIITKKIQYMHHFKETIMSLV